MSGPDSSDKRRRLAATFCGLGRLPLAPGTWGTLGAAALHALAAGLVGTGRAPYLLPLLAAAFTLASLRLGLWAEKFYGRKDPLPFVIDEAAGYLLAVSFFPFAPQFRTGVIAFVLFRVFDVVKPFPARAVEKLRGGAGIVADDLVAGLYTALFTWLISLALFGG